MDLRQKFVGFTNGMANLSYPPFHDISQLGSYTSEVEIVAKHDRKIRKYRTKGGRHKYVIPYTTVHILQFYICEKNHYYQPFFWVGGGVKYQIG